MKRKVRAMLKENGLSFSNELYEAALALYWNETKLMFGLTQEFKLIWIANRMTQIRLGATYIKPLGSGKNKIVVLAASSSRARLMGLQNF